jgi:hypothetical protein
MSTQLLFVPSHAIQTKYHGVLFHSRIEARWAVFYDALGVEWEYEKEGYHLPGELGPYLPDFWIPSLDSWVEIKGKKPDSIEMRKAFALSEMTGKMTYIFYGKIPYPDPSYNSETESAEAYYPDSSWDCGYHWCQCPDCGKFGIQFEGRSDRLLCKRRAEDPCPKHSHNEDRGHNQDTKDLLRAYGAASLARF